MLKRILIENEASFLNTGFSNYGRNLLEDLSKTGEFELAELGSYGHPNDNRTLGLPWKYYGVLPTNGSEEQIYNADIENQFGKWKFEETCLDFRPDIVVSFRDHWHCDWIALSPFRHNFDWVWMTCVDSEPLQDKWVSTYSNVDRITGYTDWGVDSVARHTGKKTNCFPHVGACPDISWFKPVADKRAWKQKFGLLPDINIIGTVMRNQKRKLFPDIIAGFRKFLQQCESSNRAEIGQKTYLYIHSSYPDVGFDFAELLRTNKVGHKVLFTYCCNACGGVFPSFFRGAVANCVFCKNFAAHMPNSNQGVSREKLYEIYNCMDLYTQGSICEGFGIPLAEAAACGVPVIGPNYSGTAEVVEKCHGWKIKVKRFYKESETGCVRSYFDIDHMIELWFKYFNMPESSRRELGEKAQLGVNEHFSFERAINVWYEIFDSCPQRPHSETWDSPYKFHRPPGNIPNNLNNADFVRWCITNIWGRPDMVNSPYALTVLKHLNMGAEMDSNFRGKPVTRDTVFQDMVNLNNRHNHFERLRYAKNNKVSLGKKYSLV